MSKTHDQKLLLRLPNPLIDAMDQVLKEHLPDMKSNRSEFMRRAIRFCIDNIDQYKQSESAFIAESQPIESVEKINAVRDQWAEIDRYTNQILIEPASSVTEKRLAFLLRLLGQMIFRMND